MFSWNYPEAGHRKRAPDGVGATCERIADQVFAQKGDTMNLHELMTHCIKNAQQYKFLLLKMLMLKEWMT